MVEIREVCRPQTRYLDNRAIRAQELSMRLTDVLDFAVTNGTRCPLEHKTIQEGSSDHNQNVFLQVGIEEDDEAY